MTIDRFEAIIVEKGKESYLRLPSENLGAFWYVCVSNGWVLVPLSLMRELERKYMDKELKL